MNTMEAIKARRSIRSFNANPVEEEKLQAILEAGACAPNGAGLAVFYTVVSGDSLEAVKGKAAVAMKKEEGFDPFFGAQTAIFMSAAPHPLGIDVANAACSAENMMIAATDLGVGSIYLLGFLAGILNSDETFPSFLGLDEGQKPILCLAIGYTDNPPAPREVAIKNVVYLK
ncbi:MAG: nitroreductase family protein [Eubacteriaceae bacterium]|nr:nitroreductase family protein [Eubacteriaceae bacterium]